MRFPFSLVFVILIPIPSCQAQNKKSESILDSIPTDKISQFIERHPESQSKSISKGTVSKGSLVNGKLMPFSGPNFHYFDTTSYISGRAFVQDKVRTTLVNTFQKLEQLAPDRQFCVMECSHEHGGKLYPHRTHQNGLSVDFMVPLLKNGKPYYGLDNTGAEHYFLDFDDSGKYLKDKSIEIDFNLVALHILQLQEEALRNGLQIEKVIFKMELKDELYATENGKKLKNSSIYITRKLSPLINALHDDHFHIDFKPK